MFLLKDLFVKFILIAINIIIITVLTVEGLLHINIIYKTAERFQGKFYSTLNGPKPNKKLVFN